MPRQWQDGPSAEAPEARNVVRVAKVGLPWSAEGRGVMGALNLVTDCAICGAMGKGDWCGDDREEPDSPGNLCPCGARHSKLNRAGRRKRAQKGGEK